MVDLRLQSDVTVGFEVGFDMLSQLLTYPKTGQNLSPEGEAARYL